MARRLTICFVPVIQTVRILIAVQAIVAALFLERLMGN